MNEPVLLCQHHDKACDQFASSCYWEQWVVTTMVTMVQQPAVVFDHE